jgi:hypothetical protein
VALGAFTPPHPVAMERIAPASFYLDSAKLAREGVLDGVIQSANWSSQKLTTDMKSFMLPYHDGVRQAGKQVGVWLNDIFSPHGGETGQFAAADQVETYWQKHVADSSMDFVVVHEADFIVRHPQEGRLWKVLEACA